METKIGEVTILDVLEVDLCRDAILDYVPIRDLVRSERVCRRWQQAVLDYLLHCGDVTLQLLPLLAYEEPAPRESHRTININKRCRKLERKLFEKFGLSIVSIRIGSNNKELYESIATYCSRLRMIEFDLLWSHGSTEALSESELGDIFQNFELEHVKFCKRNITGEILHSLKCNSIKSLCFYDCGLLELHHLLCNASSFHNLTNLELDACSMEILLNLHLLLDELPKLESLSLRDYNYSVYPEKPHLNNEFIESVCRLSNLKSLDLARYTGEYDLLLESLARGCQNLEYLNIYGTRISYKDIMPFVFRDSSGFTTFYCGHIRNESYDALRRYALHIARFFEGRGRLEVDLEELRETARVSEEKDQTLKIRFRQPGNKNAKSSHELKIIFAKRYLDVNKILHQWNISPDWMP